MSPRISIGIVAPLLCWALSSQLVGNCAEPPAAAEQPAPSLDDELLKDLESDLGEPPAVDSASKKPGTPSTGEPAARSDKERAEPGQATDDLLDEDALDNALLRELRSDFDEDDDAPLSQIGRAMRQAEKLVTQAKGGQPTQELQNKIVVDLDKLLADARRRQQQSKSPKQGQQSSSRQSASKQSQPGGSAGASDQPARDGTDDLKDRTAARPDPQEMKDLLRDLWGHLPEHERQMVINSTIEQFLPKYELMIEAYFKRLTEEAAK